MEQLGLCLGSLERAASPRRGGAEPTFRRPDQLGLFEVPQKEEQPETPHRSANRPKNDRPIQVTIRGQMRVEQFLRTLLGPKVMVQLTENRSTMLSFSVKKGVHYVRLHAIFADAPEHILGAVARFVCHRRPGPKAQWLIDQWIESHRHLVKKRGRKPRVLPRGEVHDLQAIFNRINKRYFKNKVRAQITWSTAARGQRRSSIRMGSYSEDEDLIRIHPALDQSFVPEFFVASVVFHEMLHELHGAHMGSDGCRRVHTPAFRRDEARFEAFAQARAWETKNLHRLLKY